MRAARLAALELKRFLGGRLLRAALAAVMVVPLLYGALYLWAFWDPYGELDRVPVALVDADRPVTVDGRRLSAGRDLERSLLERRVFDWKVVDEPTARRGVEDGTYYLSLTIPRDFSARLAAADSPQPRLARLRVRSNDETSYMARLVSRHVFSEIRAAASSAATTSYLDAVLAGFTSIRDRTGQAADGAGRLAAGLGRADTGAGFLREGADRAVSGGAALDAGLRRLSGGGARLAAGADRATDGARRLAAGLDRLAGRTADLPGSVRALARGADRVALGAAALPGTVRGAAGGAAGLAEGATRAQRALRDYLSRNPAAGADPAFVAALSGTGQVAAGTAGLRDQLSAAESPAQQLAAGATAVAAGAGRLAAAAPRLATGTRAAADAADLLAGGTADLASGSRRVDGGLARARDGADQLGSGLERLSAGSERLERALVRLAGGGRQLRDRLAQGAAAVPAYSPQARAQHARIMGDPVQLATTALNEAPNYGTGLAPYFIPLALWIGALVTYLVLRPTSGRALASNAPAWLVAVGGYLPAAVVGVVQVTLLLLALDLGLGLRPTQPVMLWLLMYAAALAFAAIMQLVMQVFGTAGRFVGIVLLMLQVTSSAGTFPIETSPAFFRLLSPLMPMTYAVRGLRACISGTAATPVLLNGLVLLGFAAGALLLTTLATRRARVWSLARLHPEMV